MASGWPIIFPFVPQGPLPKGAGNMTQLSCGTEKELVGMRGQGEAESGIVGMALNKLQERTCCRCKVFLVLLNFPTWCIPRTELTLLQSPELLSTLFIPFWMAKLMKKGIYLKNGSNHSPPALSVLWRRSAHIHIVTQLWAVSPPSVIIKGGWIVQSRGVRLCLLTLQLLALFMHRPLDAFQLFNSGAQ